VLGALPPALFGSGHSFFIQGLRQGALSVHATFQFGDDASFPYGKRMRLRQFGLWADPQAYFQGRFLALADAPLTPPPTLPDDDLAAQRLLLGLQFDADAVWRRRVTVGLAAARALNRTLVLPRAACYCERSWAALLRCRLPAVPRMPLEKITVPVLVAHHEQDGCRLCAFSDLPPLMGKLAKTPKSELISFTGGQSTGDPCDAMAYHGFNGLEADVVSKITAWMLAAKP
jgi:pimeloyl-ACP methyl ester carboxylesterase